VLSRRHAEQRLSDERERVRAEWQAVASGWRQREPLFQSFTWPVALRMAAVAHVGDGARVLDVGCGTGALLRHVRMASPAPITRMVGVDIIAPEKPLGHGMQFVSGWVEDLPFADQSFDTVICTHVIEHILNYRRAIEELRRVARRRLIIVVPREREGMYTFNPHLNFFPYKHSFLRAMIPVPASHVCEDVGRDIYYREDLTAAVAKAA
jgi:ubiquinone/menaquinone biosynthesis C-methylase UbiE